MAIQSKECSAEGCERPVDGKRTYCYKCRFMKNKFGITEPERNKMLKEQGDCCLICHSEIEFKGAAGVSNSNAVIDHDHAKPKGQARGILCSACNVGLGAFRDNTTSLLNAISYLQENK